MKIETPVLIVGGGPVGLALALELGWRGVECLLVDELERDGYKTHPRANLVNSRTMEFCRRWGIAGRVKELGAPLSIYFRAKNLWDWHDKGKGVLHFIVGPTGVWATLNSLNGGDLWRVTLHGGAKEHAAPESIDHKEVLTRIVGYGMNTGMGDAVDLGWKLSAALSGWAGPQLLDSYDAERRPVALRNVEEATRNFQLRSFAPVPDLVEATPAGEAARKRLGEEIVKSTSRELLSDGIALGYRYDGSPIVCPDGSEPPPLSVTEYVQTTFPGARAPHVRLADWRSTLDVFGKTYVMLRLSRDAPGTGPFEDAAKRRGVPLEVAMIEEPAVCSAYERKLVLVRPDGHVAWRGDALPADAAAVIARMTGAG